MALLACAGPLGGPLSAQAASRDLRSAARSAEAGYERTARWLAPTTFGGGAQQCDEVVGRFCLTFDTISKPPKQPERPEVAAARAKAIAAVQQYFDVEPGALDAAAPLVRLLIEDGRAEAAVAAARRFAVRTDSAVWRDWLLGYALHAAGDDEAAAQHFERALAQLPLREREEITAIDWLLDPPERARVRKLDPVSRDAYVRRFWSIADPRLATPVNEARVQHIARHLEARMRARIPRVVGMLAWGRDLDELTVRYGSPIARERVLSGRITDTGESFVEHFDTSALALAPRALLRHGLLPPPPGERWALAEPAPRSAHAIPSVPRIEPLPHQLTRYPRGDSMLVRVDLAVSDSSAGQLTAALLVLNRSGARSAERNARLAAGVNQLTLELLVPRDSQFYGAEVYDTDARRLYRARYALEPLPAGRIQLSDLRLTAPMPDDSTEAALSPLTDLRLMPARTLALHAEVHGIRPGVEYEVDVGFAPASRPSVLARGLGWLGSQLGLVRERNPARVRWLDRAAAQSSIAVNVTAPSRPGQYFLEVRVRSGRHEASTRRLVRVLSEGGAAES